MALIKHNIVPNGYAQHGRHLPQKNLIRLAGDKVTVSGASSGSGSILSFLVPPDDMRTDDFSGALLYRWGLWIVNPADDVTLTFNLAGAYLHNNNIEGTTRTDGFLSSTGSTYYEGDAILRSTSIAGVDTLSIVNGTGYWEVIRDVFPSAFRDIKVNPLGLLKYEAQYTYTATGPVTFYAIPFVDFANMKD